MREGDRNLLLTEREGTKKYFDKISHARNIGYSVPLHALNRYGGSDS